MPSMTRHLGVALLAVAALWTAGRASAVCNNNGSNTHCNYDCDCDCGYVCDTSVPSSCKLVKDFPNTPGHCDPQNSATCACRIGLGSTVDQTCASTFTCSPTWDYLKDAGDLILKDAGPPPVADCQFDIDCHCGNHCIITLDGGFHCVSFFDAGGPVGGSCSCGTNAASSCVHSTCGCPSDICACDNMNCDDGGAGTCHPGDAGPVIPPDAGRDCLFDRDCPLGCHMQVCSHAMTYFLCVDPTTTGDPGWCTQTAECPCTDQVCNTSINSCQAPAVDAGPDAGHDGGPVQNDAGGTGGTTGSTTGGTTSSGCGSTGNAAASLAVLGLIGAALIARRRQFAGRP
jgi:uncharacterized protein (TIGR03382 family)